MRKLTIGIACVIIGIMMMAYAGYDMFANDKLLDARSIKIIKENNRLTQWSPVVGLGLFAGDIMIFVRAKRNLNKS